MHKKIRALFCENGGQKMRDIVMFTQYFMIRVKRERNDK